MKTYKINNFPGRFYGTHRCLYGRFFLFLVNFNLFLLILAPCSVQREFQGTASCSFTETNLVLKPVE